MRQIASTLSHAPGGVIGDVGRPRPRSTIIMFFQIKQNTADMLNHEDLVVSYNSFEKKQAVAMEMLISGTTY